MKNKHRIYRQSFETEQKALNFCNNLSTKGVIQQIGNFWQVWQFISWQELVEEVSLDLSKKNPEHKDCYEHHQ